MAQDFYAAFGLGLDDKHIGTIDEGGVALARDPGPRRRPSAGHGIVNDSDPVRARFPFELVEGVGPGR